MGSSDKGDTRARLSGLHEDYGREQAPQPGSARSFGLVMAIALPLITWVFIRNLWVIGVVIGAGFALTAWLRPGLLEPLNRAWFQLGMLLSRIVAPVIMGLIFYLVVTPIGLIRRALGKDSLGLKSSDAVETYWQKREPPGPEPGDLPRQF